MKKTVLLFALLLAGYTLFAQDYRDFYSQSLDINRTGMYVLGGWSVANLVTGGTGWALTEGSTKYFHQMNLFWNTVNLGIAGFALHQASATDLSLLSDEMMMSRHLQAERLFLINAGLDVLYVGTGFLLKHLSKTNTKRPDRLKGYGNSLILQGSFLFAFDLVMYGMQHHHRLEFLENLQLGVNQVGYRISF